MALLNMSRRSVSSGRKAAPTPGPKMSGAARSISVTIAAAAGVLLDELLRDQDIADDVVEAAVGEVEERLVPAGIELHLDALVVLVEVVGEDGGGLGADGLALQRGGRDVVALVAGLG